MADTCAALATRGPRAGMVVLNGAVTKSTVLDLNVRR